MLSCWKGQGSRAPPSSPTPAPSENNSGNPAYGAPSACSCPVHICKPTAATAAAVEASIPKQPSKKVLAAEAKLQKEEARQKSIQALAIYETKIKVMGFEEAPWPPPPHAAAATTLGSKKIPGIFRDLDVIMMNISGMDVDDDDDDDDDGGIEDLIVEIHDNFEPDEEDRMLQPGFK